MDEQLATRDTGEPRPAGRGPRRHRRTALVAFALGIVSLAPFGGAPAGAEACAGFHGRLTTHDTEFAGVFDDLATRPITNIELSLIDTVSGTSSVSAITGADGTFCIPTNGTPDRLRFNLFEAGQERFEVRTVDDAGNPESMEVRISLNPDEFGTAEPLDVQFRWSHDSAAGIFEQDVYVGGKLRTVNHDPGTPSISAGDVIDALTIHHFSRLYLDWWETTFADATFAPLPNGPATHVDIVIRGQQTQYNLRENTGNGVIDISLPDSSYVDRQQAAFEQGGAARPENGEWHELNHYTWDLNGLYDDVEPDENHGGWINESSHDSVAEGWASFAATAAGQQITGVYPNDIYGPFGSMESNDLRAYNRDSVSFREDHAFTGLLWDLYDGQQGPDGLTDCIATPTCDTALRTVRPDADIPQLDAAAALTDVVSLPIDLLYRSLIAIDPDTTVAGLHEQLLASAEVPDELKDPSAVELARWDIPGTNDEAVWTVSHLDAVFLLHSFHPCDPGANPNCYPVFGDPVGPTDNVPDGSGGLVPRRNRPINPGAAIRLVNDGPEAAIVALQAVDTDGLVTDIEAFVGAQSTTDLALQLPPYYTFPDLDGSATPDCSAANEALTTISMVDRAVGGTSLGGAADFDTCQYETLIADSNGQPALSFLVGSVAVRYRVEFVDASRQNEPGVVTVDGNLQFSDFKDAFDEVRIDPDIAGTSLSIDGLLKLYVPALEALAPVKMPGATVELNATASTQNGVEAFSARLQGQVIFEEELLDVDLSIAFADADAGTVQSIDASLQLAGLDGASVVTTAELADLIGFAAYGDVLPVLSVDALSVDFHWDPGSTTIDGTVRTTLETVGLGIDLLLSVDDTPTTDPQFLIGARFDDATDPSSDTISLDSLLGGDLGTLATNLEFPEFALVAAFPGTEPLTAADLRAEQLEFFEPAGLPGDLELASTLSLAAEIELDALGPDVRNLFGYAEMATATLSGRLGFTFTDFAADGVTIEDVALDVTLPGTDGAAAGLLPDWLAFPEGVTLSLTWNADDEELVLGAATRVDVTLEGDTVVTDLRGEITAGSTALSASFEAELREEWISPFEIPWLTVTAAKFTFQVEVTGSDLSMAAELSGSAEIAVGAGEPVQTTARLAISLEGDTPQVTADVDVDGISVRAILDALGIDTSAVPPEIDLELSGTIAAGVSPDEFEIAVLATVELAGLTPVPLAADLLASATVGIGGGDSGLTLGIQLRGADGPLMLSDLLGDDLPFDTTLPAVGLAFSTSGLTGDESALNTAEFEFFKTLYGCLPTDERDVCPLTAADGGPLVDLPPAALVLLTNLPLPTPTALMSDNPPADIPTDQQLSDLLWQFGVDVTRGVQVTGIVSLDGPSFALTVDLPPISNATGELPDWIDYGTLQLALDLSPTDGLSVRLEGGVGVRLRQAEDPIDSAEGPSTSECSAAVSAGGLGGVPRLGYDQDGLVKSQYCYEVIPLTAGFEIGVDGGLKVSGDIGLGAADSDYVWEAPFGLEWLEIRAIVLELSVAIQPTGTPTINVGAFGSMSIFGKDVAGAGALGIRVIQATPFVLPDFKGFRIRSEAGIELNDFYRIYKFVAETADPTTDLPDHVSELGLPNPALKNLDFGLAIENNDRLCLQLGIIASTDFYSNYVPPPDPPPGPDRAACVPIGDAQPDPACHEVPDECFASMFFSLSEDGLFASGSLSPFDLGPVHWDGGLVDFALSPEVQRFVLDGGVSVDGLGGGSVAILVEPTRAEFFGALEIEGGFEAQVSGDAQLLLPEAGDPFPRIGGSAHFDLAMRNQFEQNLRADIASELREIAEEVGAVEQLWNDFADDPLGAIGEVVDQLEAAGVAVPTWASELADQLADLDEAEYPTLGELLGQLDISFQVPALPTCPAGYLYLTVGFADGCFNDEGDFTAPTGFTCPLGTLDGESCTIGFSFSEVFPADVADVLDEIAARLATVLSNIDLIPAIPMDFSPSAFITRLAEVVEAPALVSIDCAAFSVDVTITTNELSAQVDFGLLLTLLGDQHALGFSLALPNMAAISELPGPDPDQIATFVTQLLDAFVRGDTSTAPCAQEQATPAWYEAATEAQEELDLTIDVDRAEIPEGDSISLSGDFGTTTTDPVTVTIDWGDDSVETLLTTGSGFVVEHTYDDDDPTPEPFDVQTIVATIEGGASDTTAVTVHNVAPVVTLAVDNATPTENDEVALTATIDDPGTDQFLMAVLWGDGTDELVVVDTVGDVVLTHRYLDDDPTRTSQDQASISVTVGDDDGGEARAVTSLTIANADPTVAPAIVTNFENTTVEEGVAASFTVEFDDVGPADRHVVEVGWGDGTSSRRTVNPGGSRTLVFSHTYADDDPSGTSSDVYGATITVFDDDLGRLDVDADVTVHNVDPIVSVQAEPAAVQYSDPVDDVVIIATDVAGDPLSPSTPWSVDGGPATAGIPGAWTLTDDGCDVDDVANTRTCQWTFGGITDLPPGEYVIGVTVADDDLGATTVDIPITVLPEDARAYYVGPVFAATTDALDDTAVIELRATIQDITLAVDDPDWDPYPGDILHAEVRFVDRENGDATLCTAELGYTFPDEIGLATAWCDWEADIGNSDAESFVIGVVVEGWYTRNQTDDDTIVTVARPLDQFITGGGFLDIVDSEGQYAADPDTKANFGFNVKFNKKGKNLQGRAILIVRAAGRVYRIKTNALTSLGVVEVDEAGTGVAEFEAKANIVDVTEEDAPISLGGNLTFQMRMTDHGEPGDTDTIGFTLWDKDGELLHSSSWADVQTVEQLLGGGNLVVHE